MKINKHLLKSSKYKFLTNSYESKIIKKILVNKNLKKL